MGVKVQGQDEGKSLLELVKKSHLISPPKKNHLNFYLHLRRPNLQYKTSRSHLIWGLMEIDLLLEPASNGPQLQFLAFQHWVHFTATEMSLGCYESSSSILFY